jgi:isocitrate dehydrogenase (NAD+)
LGLTGSGNIGRDCSLFEAVHGSAPDIAGRNVANPTALLLSSVMVNKHRDIASFFKHVNLLFAQMLHHMGLANYGERIQNGIFKVIEEGKYITRDIGGKANTTDYVKAVIDKL